MRRIVLLAFLAIVLPSWGCGYHFSAASPIVLPGGVVDIAIRDVNNPTLEGWLDPFLRTRFRDEFTRRARVNWVDQERAQAHVNLTVISYFEDTELSGAKDRTLRERVEVVLKTEIFSHPDGRLLWSSGPVKASETFEAGTSRVAAGEKVIEEAVRRTADGLGVDY